MGTFDPQVDAPKQIKQEGEELIISFERTGSTTGTVTWQIPPPANGCTSDNQAYSGIAIILNTVANKVENRPVNGTMYIADSTADVDLHVGDKINGALVVGAFYDDKTTTSLELTGLTPDAAYFITGHVVDGVYTYHFEGMSTYSLPFLYLEPKADSCAYHEIGFNGSTINGTDATNLNATGSYTVDLQVDSVQYQLTISGADALTFDELVEAFNNAIDVIENPFAGPTAPNTGAYWYDSSVGKLYQWDGDSHVEIAVITELTNPVNVIENEYWLNSTTEVLSKWTGSPLAWATQTTIDIGWNPAVPTCDAFWDQTTGATQMWKWDGSVWCTRPTYVQDTDPSCPPTLTCSSYWYDETSEMLFVWDVETSAWVQTEGIAWDVDPTAPAIGTLWYDDVQNKLYKRTNSTTWTEQSVTLSETAPSFPVVGAYWFVPSTSELFTFSTGSPLWAATEVLLWGADPTVPGSCELWWDTSSSPATVLNVRDSLNNIWTPVNSFTIGTTDPSLAQTLEIGTIWHQGPHGSAVYWEWDGSQFVQILDTNVATTLTDPSVVTIGDVWHETVNDIYYERTANSGSPELSAWTVIDVISSTQDPNLLAVGSFWYDSTNGTLNMWNGASWVTVLFSTSSLEPTDGTLWFNTTSKDLFEWNTKSFAWIDSTPIAVVTLNDSKGVCSSGNIIFTTTNCGSYGQVLVGTETLPSGLSIFVDIGYSFTGTLFPALSNNGYSIELKPNVIGTDGLTGVASYDTIGVGTDGTSDERRELADSIRKQLGYPTVEVELTKYQINTAIDKALEALRQRSASAYRRVYFFLDCNVGQQNYLMTNARVGFNKITQVMGCWRITSAFMSTVHAAGVYGQTILQHLYHQGTYDLVSYHLISDYIEQLEQLFATRVVYTFDEGSRELFIFQRFTRDERMLLDCVIERTEQELLVNRWTKPWIERWALAESRIQLAEIRGKYASLPGAGGGVSLNAGDLVTKAETDFAQCQADIDDFIVNDVENLGIGSEFIIG